MLVESKVYRLLNADDELNSLLDTLRGSEFDPGVVIKQGVFVYSIPEDYRKMEIAPFVRINPIDEDPIIFMDDTNKAERQTVQVDFWCKNSEHSRQIKNKIDELLKNNGFTQYDSKRYQDPDINLIMNVRKYRVLDFNI